MNYNPAKHHRRSGCLAGYDYSEAGAYFITIYLHATPRMPFLDLWCLACGASDRI